MKEHHRVDTCKQEHQVCTGFSGGLGASVTDRADRSQWDRFSVFSKPDGQPNGVLTVAY